MSGAREAREVTSSERQTLEDSPEKREKVGSTHISEKVIVAFFLNAVEGTSGRSGSPRRDECRENFFFF